jgi:hypothetical protein
MKLRTMLAASLMTVVIPSAARADWIATPFVGPAFGIGTIGGGGPQTAGAKLTYGGAFGVLGPGAIGFEVDFGRSPTFVSNPPPCEVCTLALFRYAQTTVTTVMGSALIAPWPPSARVRPYGVVGAGLIRSANIGGLVGHAPGLTVGGGVFARLTEHAGVRAELRYVKGLRDDNQGGIAGDKLSFWRNSMGLAFQF